MASGSPREPVKIFATFLRPMQARPAVTVLSARDFVRPQPTLLVEPGLLVTAPSLTMLL
jgi:hypothetical protein